MNNIKQHWMMLLFAACLTLGMSLTACGDDDTTTPDPVPDVEADADPDADPDTDDTGDGGDADPDAEPDPIVADADPDADDTGDGGDADGGDTDGGDTDGGDTDGGDADADAGDLDPAAFLFADDDFGDYVRVDRVGMPALATAVVPQERRDAYNAANPSDDQLGVFLTDIAGVLVGLLVALEDDLAALTYDGCADYGELPTEDAFRAECVAQAGALIFPDTLKINTAEDAGFPNGRALADPVVDITLAVALLDVTGLGETDGNCPNTGDSIAPCTGATLVGVLNPAANDVAFSETFPYVAAAHTVCE